MGLVTEAVHAGARQARACAELGIDPRTYQRWLRQEIGDDCRAGSLSPVNKLTQEEEDTILEVVNQPKYRDLAPKQLVPILADQGIYLASESTIYRILRRHGQATHRSAAAPATRRHKPQERIATGPNQVWSWDITYLKSSLRGSFYYLYMVMDVWSRKVVGWAVHEEESPEHAARLIRAAYAREGVKAGDLVLHADNGGPMKGSTMLATMQRLGVVSSFSRPSVSNDNPYSESLFRNLKYRPEYPRQGAFGSLAAAQAWIELFVAWYNTEHRHSSIRYVTPQQRHDGLQEAILSNRHRVYQEARRDHPRRWSRQTRDWSPVKVVRLNPDQAKASEEVA
jgi:transposase InsO family protein